MTKREGYSKRMERNLAAWKTRFETEQADAGKAGDDAGKADQREKLATAKVAGDAAFAKFGELKLAAARWTELRDQMDVAWLAIAGGPQGEADVAASPMPRASSG